MTETKKAIKLGQRTTAINWEDGGDMIEKMYAELECERVEFIDLPKISKAIIYPQDKTQTVTMICDEEAKITIAPIFNATASALYEAEFGRNIDYIAGKVLLMKVDGEGRTRALDEGEIARMKYLLQHRAMKNAAKRIAMRLTWAGHDVF